MTHLTGGNSWTSRLGTFDDNATDRTAIGEFFVALVHDVGDVQSLLLACRIARRLDRAGFAGGPRRHRLVLNSPTGYPYGALVLAVRAAMEQGYLRQSRRFANSLQ